MFTVLKVSEKDRGIRAFFRNLLTNEQPTLTRINVKDGAPFFTLEVKQDKNGLDYAMISGILGIGAKRVIVENGVDLPENQYLKQFVPQELPSIMLFNSAKRIIEKCEKPESERICAVVDPNAELMAHIHELVPLTSILKVVTSSPDRYEGVADDIFDEWGLPIIITQNNIMLSDCDFIISPFKNDYEIYSECIVIKYKEDKPYIRVRGEGITLPEEYEEIIPDNISELKFASALYELSAVRKLGTLSFDRIVKI